MEGLATKAERDSIKYMQIKYMQDHKDQEFLGVVSGVTEWGIYVEIIENKYVLNVKCSVWDKNTEIEYSFDYIKTEIKNHHNLALISFDDAYNYYYKFCNNQSNKLIVSKRYFEKYLYSKIPKYIVYEKFIETIWIDE